MVSSQKHTPIQINVISRRMPTFSNYLLMVNTANRILKKSHDADSRQILESIVCVAFWFRSSNGNTLRAFICFRFFVCFLNADAGTESCCWVGVWRTGMSQWRKMSVERLIVAGYLDPFHIILVNSSLTTQVTSANNWSWKAGKEFECNYYSQHL